MTLLYRVIENFDPYAVPGANYVQGCGDHVVAYKMAPGYGKTQTLAIAYRDPSGTWLVAAEPTVMAMLPGDHYSLQYWIDAGRPWHTWTADGYDDSDVKERVMFEKRIVTITDGIPIDVSVLKPVSLGNARFAVGCRASVKSQLGSFRPDEIEKDVNWVGDKIDLLYITKELIM